MGLLWLCGGWLCPFSSCSPLCCPGKGVAFSRSRWARPCGAAWPWRVTTPRPGWLAVARPAGPVPRPRGVSMLCSLATLGLHSITPSAALSSPTGEGTEGGVGGWGGGGRDAGVTVKAKLCPSLWPVSLIWETTCGFSDLTSASLKSKSSPPKSHDSSGTGRVGVFSMIQYGFHPVWKTGHPLPPHHVRHICP